MEVEGVSSDWWKLEKIFFLTLNRVLPSHYPPSVDIETLNDFTSDSLESLQHETLNFDPLADLCLSSDDVDIGRGILSEEPFLETGSELIYFIQNALRKKDYAIASLSGASERHLRESIISESSASEDGHLAVDDPLATTEEWVRFSQVTSNFTPTVATPKVIETGLSNFWPEPRSDLFTDLETVRSSSASPTLKLEIIDENAPSVSPAIDVSERWTEHLRDHANYSPNSLKRFVHKPRMDLPMILGGETVLSTPDSGSEENIISKELISNLGLKFDHSPDRQKEFRMGNNKIVKALGCIDISCQFARDPKDRWDCLFYVFNTLITPLIMGMKFLADTDTLTKNKHRLQPCSIPRNGPFLCASLNNSIRRLPFYTFEPIVKLHGTFGPFHNTLANADTGSEINLMSLHCCKRFGLSLQEIQRRESRVQFADGSLATLAGKISIQFAFYASATHFHRKEFYVLENLTCDVLLGRDLTEETSVFETYSNSFSIEDDLDLAQVNTIVWFKTPERFLAGLGRNNNPASQPLSAISETKLADNSTIAENDPVNPVNPIPLSRREMMVERVHKFMEYHWGSGRKPKHEEPLLNFEARMDERDARENRRREEAERIIAALPAIVQFAARQEELKLIEKFELDKELVRAARRSAQMQAGPSNTSNSAPSRV